MEYLFLENIIVHGSLGVYAEEERLGNNFIIDIKIFADFDRSKESDSLSDTVDYQTIHELIKEAAAQPIHLLEHLAHKISNRLENIQRIDGFELKIRKEWPPLNGQVGASGFYIKKDFKK